LYTLGILLMRCNLFWCRGSAFKKMVDLNNPFVDISSCEIEPAIAVIDGIDSPIWLMTSGDCPDWIHPRFSAEDAKIEGRTCWQNLVEKDLYAVRANDVGRE
jgi:hypothetical protein